MCSNVNNTYQGDLHRQTQRWTRRFRRGWTWLILLERKRRRKYSIVQVKKKFYSYFFFFFIYSSEKSPQRIIPSGDCRGRNNDHCLWKWCNCPDQSNSLVLLHMVHYFTPLLFDNVHVDLNYSYVLLYLSFTQNERCRDLLRSINKLRVSHVQMISRVN